MAKRGKNRKRKKPQKRAKPGTVKRRAIRTKKQELRDLRRQRGKVTKDLRKASQDFSTTAKSFRPIIGITEHAELVKTYELLSGPDASNVDEETRVLIADELKRRKSPTPFYVRPSTDADDRDAHAARSCSRAKLWAEHYGFAWKDPDDREIWPAGFVDASETIPVQFPKTENVGATFEPTSGNDMATMWLDNSDEAKDKRLFEVPVRLLVHDGLGRMYIDYVLRREATLLEDIEAKYLGGPFKVIGTPPHHVALKSKRGNVTVYASCMNTLRVYGEITREELVLEDLTPEGEAFYTELILDGKTPTEAYGGVVTNTVHKQIIDNYIAIRSALIQDDFPRGEDEDRVKGIWPLVRDAVIFEFPPAAYNTLYTSYIKHFGARAELLAARDGTDKGTTYERILSDAVATAPWPEHLPFAATYFAYGRGIPTETVTHDKPAAYSSGKHDALLLAHLITDTGDVIAFMGWLPIGSSIHTASVKDLLIAPVFERKDGAWVSDKTLDPFALPTLIDYVNDHKTFVEEGARGLNYKTLVGRSAKQMGVKPPIPPPYYVVYLQDQLVQGRARRRQKIAKKVEWQHRWRTRGSWNVRFRRGPLPIDEKLERKLKKRRYQVFTVTRPDGDLAAELAKRGITPKSPNEWLAVLRYWRNEHVKGPADKPLIESVRRSTKEWKEPNE